MYCSVQDRKKVSYHNHLYFTEKKFHSSWRILILYICTFLIYNREGVRNITRTNIGGLIKTKEEQEIKNVEV